MKTLSDECRACDVTFTFCGTGRCFVKDGKTYHIEGNGIQSRQAYKSGLSYQGTPIEWQLTDEWGYPIPEDQLYKPYFGERCRTCGMQYTCNSYSRCGAFSAAAVLHFWRFLIPSPAESCLQPISRMTTKYDGDLPGANVRF